MENQLRRKKHNKTNPLTSAKHTLNFRIVPLTSDGELQAALTATWVIKGAKWNYSLTVNGIEIEPAWSRQSGEAGNPTPELIGSAESPLKGDEAAVPPNPVAELWSEKVAEASAPAAPEPEAAAVPEAVKEPDENPVSELQPVQEPEPTPEEVPEPVADASPVVPEVMGPSTALQARLAAGQSNENPEPSPQTSEAPAPEVQEEVCSPRDAQHESMQKPTQPQGMAGMSPAGSIAIVADPANITTSEDPPLPWEAREVVTEESYCCGQARCGIFGIPGW